MDSAENNPNIDPRLLEHLNRHKLTRLVSLLAEAEITSKDLVKFRRNPTLVSGVLPKVRDQLDFTDSLRNVTIDQGAQTDITFFKDLGNTNNVTLTQICELNTNGQKFLRAYIRPNGTKAPITDPMRYHVRNALVEHYYPICEGSITDPWLTQMRDIVMAELPDEDPESWYVAAADGQPASGLLYDRYRTYRKGMRKKAREQQGQNLVNQHSASVKKKRKRPEVQDPAPESQPKPESQWTALTAEEKNVNTAAKLKLSGMGFSDEAAVKMAWAQSYSLRRHEAVTGVLNLTEWDVLKHFTDTAALVTIDFNTIHGIREDKFHAKLPIFIQRFKRLHEGFLNLIEGDKELLAEAVTSFKSADVNEKSIFLSFYCLPLIIRQGFIKRNDKKTKPSLLDSRNAFITMTETEAKVTEAVTERRKVAAQRKETVQPFIVAVGSLSEIKAVFVTFDNLLVKCRSISAAVDLCFKLHSVFHLEYAKECESVMKFIQTYFYEIRYAKDKLESRVRTFISDLNRDS